MATSARQSSVSTASETGGLGDEDADEREVQREQRHVDCLVETRLAVEKVESHRLPEVAVVRRTRSTGHTGTHGGPNEGLSGR
ncbi:hypothetical protein M0R89_01890 [Halorussus limi]|uniref:Uncharacterized protein n=1 Tax=Halorussus limi TaxID=2938695 RepID=A0A8U0HW41_9EURY|nr:hypothetical protein [Halorussus limi]UPV74834.1 hypothetical protein M0R89_01890 [Halorussus limi]